jgi:peptidoglycan/LPS O-acetylase OafA/YrhL
VSSAALKPAASRDTPGLAGRLNGIEGLRAVAAVSILVFHCFLFSTSGKASWLVDGPVGALIWPLESGVTLFFVLSGFLLYRPIAAAIVSGKPRPSVRRYLRNRALRILPAYWAVLFSSALVFGAAAAAVVKQGFVVGVIHDPGTLAADALLIGNYIPAKFLSGIPPAWSLTTEVAFYLLLPLVVVVAARVARERKRVAVWLPPATLLAIGLAGKVAIAALSPGRERPAVANLHGVLARSFLTHADLFAFGMVAAVVFATYEAGDGRPLQTIIRWAPKRLLVYAGFSALIFGYYLLPAYAYDSIVAFFAALMLLRILRPGRPERPRWIEGRIATACGKVSYSIFLWNYPVLLFMASYGLRLGSRDVPAFVVNTLVAATIVGVLSYLTYRFVELPALNLKAGRVPREHAVRGRQRPLVGSPSTDSAPAAS